LSNLDLGLIIGTSLVSLTYFGLSLGLGFGVVIGLCLGRRVEFGLRLNELYSKNKC